MATPVNSPCAPAMGVSDTACMPVTWRSMSCSSCRHASTPWERLTGASGCRIRKPGSMASVLQARGLYFIVHEPSG